MPTIINYKIKQNNGFANHLVTAIGQKGTFASHKTSIVLAGLQWQHVVCIFVGHDARNADLPCRGKYQFNILENLTSMHLLETRRDRSDLIRYSNLLFLLASLFLIRVVGQAVQYWYPLEFLPAFGDFQGSSLPYAPLLLIQLIIFVSMYRVAWKLGKGKLLPNRRAGRWLLILAVIYMVGSVARIAIGVTVADAVAWFTSWIPAVFHVVLAAFILTLAIFHLRAKGNCA